VHFSLVHDARQTGTGLLRYEPTVNFREMHPPKYDLVHPAVTLEYNLIKDSFSFSSVELCLRYTCA
jgi:hypothetical protein